MRVFPRGDFGSGAAFASASILALVVEPGLALGVMLPLLMLIDVSTLRPYWRKWDMQAAILLILGALPGVALGAALYKLTEPDVFRVLIGVISVGFVIWQVATAKGLVKAASRVLSPRSGRIRRAGGGVHQLCEPCRWATCSDIPAVKEAG